PASAVAASGVVAALRVVAIARIGRDARGTRCGGGEQRSEGHGEQPRRTEPVRRSDHEYSLGLESFKAGSPISLPRRCPWQSGPPPPVLAPPEVASGEPPLTAPAALENVAPGADTPTRFGGERRILAIAALL